MGGLFSEVVLLLKGNWPLILIRLTTKVLCPLPDKSGSIPLYWGYKQIKMLLFLSSIKVATVVFFFFSLNHYYIVKI